MVFSSIEFLFYFFPIVFALYYIFSFSRKIQNLILLLASLVFYAWGEPVNVLLLIFSILFNSFMGFLISKPNIKARKFFLVSDIVVNLGILYVFKYFVFTLDILEPLVGENDLSIALPIGISFFTFQALSYVIDVYKGKVKAQNPFLVGLYISFFPQLIAGPIIQYKDISDQIQNRKNSLPKLAMGINRFAIGVIKKVLLANIFASMADLIFNWSSIGNDRYSVPVMLAWLGAIAYTLQIYFDFSAYSDMAIGMAGCFGFSFSENFNYPYSATSIDDFWKRWHISLTSWFREYVYFPLGGSRVENRDLMVRNLFIVWLLTGIWHGANWTFVCWGLYYFVIQLAEKFFKYTEKFKYEWLKHLYALFVITIGWVLFRADNLYQAARFLMNMFGLNHNGFYSGLSVLLVRENWVFLLAGIVFVFPVIPRINSYIYNNPQKKLSISLSVLIPILTAVLFVIAVSYLMVGSYNPFIYFNF